MGNAKGKHIELPDQETWEERESRLSSECPTPRTLKCDYCGQMNIYTATHCENCGKNDMTDTITRRKSLNPTGSFYERQDDGGSSDSIYEKMHMLHKRGTIMAPDADALKDLFETAPPETSPRFGSIAPPAAQPTSSVFPQSLGRTSTPSQPSHNGSAISITISKSPTSQEAGGSITSSITSSHSSESLAWSSAEPPTPTIPAKPVTAEILSKYKVEKKFIPVWPCGLELNDEFEVLSVESASLGDLLMDVKIGDILYNVKDRPVDLTTIDELLPCEGTFLRAKLELD